MGNHKVPKFSVHMYDNWSRHMKAHLCSIHEDIWQIIEECPIDPKSLTKVNPTHAIDNNLPQIIPKLNNEMTSEEKKLLNLENIALDALYQTLDDERMKDVKDCQTVKKIWDFLADPCSESEAIRKQASTCCRQV